MAEKLLVLAYIRYSSHVQDNGNSVAAQSCCIEKYAETNKMEIENYYIDMAKTGRNTNRPKYQQLKTYIENGNVKAKTIIVRALDRLHRNAANQLEDLEWFEKNGIRLIAVNDGTDTASPNYNKLITTVKAAVAEEFSDTLSKNTRAALLECAKQCRHLGGIPPIGYNINNIGLYEIDELTAPIVRDIFNLYSKDMGYDYIKKHLKNKGYKTSTGKDFVDSSIHSILTNPKYKGTYTYDRTAPKDSEGHRNSHKEKQQYVKIPNGMPAIIKPELFDKVQEKMIKNAHKNTHRTGKNYYSLNGFMHCSECGKAFSGNVNNSNGHKYLQYKKSCDCELKSVRTDQLNKFVFYAIKNCIFNSDNKQKIINAVNKKLSIQKQINSEEINAIQNKINGFEKSNTDLMKYLESDKATDSILATIDKNQNEINQLKMQLELKNNKISKIDEEKYNELLKKFNNYMCNVKSPEAITLKEAVIDNVQIGKDDIIVNFKPGVTIDNVTKNYFNCI